MRSRQLIFKRGLLLVAFVVISFAVCASSLSDNEISDTTDFRNNEKYERRLEQRQQHWSRLIPNLLSVQYAGGQGMFSFGVGWDYGSSDRWETHFYAGFLPGRFNQDACVTLTLKECFLPWRVKVRRSPFTISPLAVSLAVNSIIHHDYWVSEPDSYPDRYYGFSSKLRFQLGLGQRLTYNIPYQHRRLGRQVTVYYEVSTCDLYVRQKVLNKSIPLGDILTVGVGVIYTI